MNNNNNNTEKNNIISKTADSAMISKPNDNKSIPSFFSDIKEVLKAIEISKSQIDMNLVELERERQNKLFYLFNSAESDE